MSTAQPKDQTQSLASVLSGQIKLTTFLIAGKIKMIFTFFSDWKELKTIFKKDFIYLFLEKGEGKEREKHQCVVASRAPYWGPSPQPRHVPWLGIGLQILWFIGPHSIHWAIPARALCAFFYFISSDPTAFFYPYINTHIKQKGGRKPNNCTCKNNAFS